MVLHIFELRYVQMLKDCIKTGSEFGTALIRSGVEVGGPAEPHKMGMTCKILRVTDDSSDSYHLICCGHKRIRIGGLSQEKIYQTCQASFKPWRIYPEGDDPHYPVLRELYLNYAALLTRRQPSETPSLQTIPSDLFKLACTAAVTLRVTNLEKQHLLETESLEELAEECKRLLRREILLIPKLASIPIESASQTDPAVRN